MDNTQLLEWFGYLATIIVGISLLMKSIIWLRWINLIGSILFSIYGYYLGSMPVLVLNSFIAIINMAYLYEIHTKKEFFKLLEVRNDNLFLIDFLKFYDADINRFFPKFHFETSKMTECFFVLRDMQVAGLFLASQHDAKSLLVEVDFAVPEYRDFKLGNFVYQSQSEYFRSKGYTRIYSKTQSVIHNNYLRQLGFKPITQGAEILFYKDL
ncbi:MAG: hypothetical protein RIS47_2229 [Bacteroidota bacterium]|jgi:hypothetical protein